ncbi:hypothetical protein P5808_28645 [Bacillus cereus]|uniref:hypothetical protein n=1 Tax=Bacillus cereus group TaxID=86661 RepID=UPI001F565DA7|nr:MULTISPECIES: hypothetical protein [Bacillus cereus group]MDF9597884.1 hypothetical protein [Bacillus cereus]MDF9610019.1 hypothetical protein [Bacillus cereus]MDF9661041.1 hypothetical protein [Bacillus cereus]
MNFTRAKIFSKENEIQMLEYGSDIEYYSFIKEKSEQGYEQVILTTDFMLAILKYYFIDRKFAIKGIVPVDEEESLVSKFKYYIDKIEEDRVYFTYLLTELDFLFNEKNSLDIFKIELSGKSLSGERMRFNIQINGIVQIKDSCYQIEKDVLIKVITGHLGWRK